MTIYTQLKQQTSIRQKSSLALKHLPHKYQTGQIKIALTGTGNEVRINQVKLVKPITPLHIAIFLPNDTVKVFYYSEIDLIKLKDNELKNQHGGTKFNSNTYTMKMDCRQKEHLVDVISLTEPLTTQQLNGQYYTTNADSILKGFEHLVKGRDVVDYTAGQQDLLKWSARNGASSITGYDINGGADNRTQDTLMNPVNLPGYFVVSNPPFLSKKGDKTALHDPLYEKYNTNDLYKAHIMSLTCDEGLMIVPANFLSESNPSARDWFFKRYEITFCKLFAYKVFADADLSVVAFHYKKVAKTPSKASFVCEIHNLEQVVTKQVEVSARYKWLVAGSELAALECDGIAIKTVSAQEPANTDIYMQNVQGGKLNFGANYLPDTTPTATSNIVSPRIHFLDVRQDKKEVGLELTPAQQLQVVEEYNKIIDGLWHKYNQLPFSNYLEAGKVIVSKRINEQILSSVVAKILGIDEPANRLFDW